jgi:hypothetical protein
MVELECSGWFSLCHDCVDAEWRSASWKVRSKRADFEIKIGFGPEDRSDVCSCPCTVYAEKGDSRDRVQKCAFERVCSKKVFYRVRDKDGRSDGTVGLHVLYEHGCVENEAMHLQYAVEQTFSWCYSGKLVGFQSWCWNTTKCEASFRVPRTHANVREAVKVRSTYL